MSSQLTPEETARAVKLHIDLCAEAFHHTLLVISDDVALPLGQFRLMASGSNGGLNGLGHIQQLIGQQYARLRMGIGNDYPQGGQIDWVLGQYSDEQLQQLQPTIEMAADIIRSFVLAGIDVTMNQFNKLRKKCPTKQE